MNATQKNKKVIADLKIAVGTRIRINGYFGEVGEYPSCEGVVTSIDHIGWLKGTWGGTVIPCDDDFEVIG